MEKWILVGELHLCPGLDHENVRFESLVVLHQLRWVRRIDRKRGLLVEWRKPHYDVGRISWITCSAGQLKISARNDLDLSCDRRLLREQASRECSSGQYGNEC